MENSARLDRQRADDFIILLEFCQYKKTTFFKVVFCSNCPNDNLNFIGSILSLLIVRAVNLGQELHQQVIF